MKVTTGTKVLVICDRFNTNFIVMNISGNYAQKCITEEYAN